MRLELHCHSTCSDGTEPAAAVAARAAARGVEVFALTDHDTCAGCPEGSIRAVEISCDEPRSGRTIHVLAYDRGTPGWGDLETKLGELREARRNRMRVMAAKLAQRGIRVDVEPILAAALGSGRTVGRPDLARAMVAMGAVKSFREAFDLHLYDGGPVNVAQHALTLVDALALGRAAGAAMSLAHPATYGDLSEQLLRRHHGDGLAGVEAFYGGYDTSERNRWITIADELGLVCTGGSDWHGPEDAYSEVGIDIPDDRAQRIVEWLRAG